MLVATGAADASGVGSGVAATVAAALPSATVRLVVGPWSSGDVPGGVEAIVSPTGLVDHLATADLVVCSAGVTALEAAAAGRPVVAVLTAPNQRRTFDGLVAAGAVVGATPDTAATAASTLAADLLARHRLAMVGRRDRRRPRRRPRRRCRPGPPLSR